MAAVAEPVSLWRRSPERFLEFLKSELAPHPGSVGIFVRTMISVVITFLLVATFRMPYAAITLYSVFTVDRSSRRAAITRALESIVAITVGVGVSVLGIVVFIDLPLLMFLFYAAELFGAIFLIRVTRHVGPAMNLGMAVYTVHNVWERPYPAGPHLEQTLWVWLTLSLGFVVAVAVELAFVRVDPLKDLYGGLANRLQALSGLFSAYDNGQPSVPAAHQAVLSYAFVGTSALRHRIASVRNAEPSLYQHLLGIATVTALVARLIDVSANINENVTPSTEDLDRMRRLASELDRIRTFLVTGRPVEAAGFEPGYERSDRIPLLPELERTAALIPAAFSTEQTSFDEAAAGLEPEPRSSVFLPDAFTNPGYILFALKGSLAALLCYIIYSAIAWAGISTSVVTCLVTSLATVGATKQKQILRLTGATFGGLLAIGSLIFLLPDIDSITGATVLIAAVSAISGWFVVSSPRLSYFGLQTALAFYLTTVQDYSATTELAPARDRFFGVLLGIAMMWLIFDNLWPVRAVDHMRTGFARNLRLLAQLVTALDQPNRAQAIRTIRSLRDRLQEGFTAVHGHADSVRFEFGSPEHALHLALRDVILRWQATARTLVITQVAISQYRTQIVPLARPPSVIEGLRTFDRTFAERLTTVAQNVESWQPCVGFEPLTIAVDALQSTVSPWLQSLSDAWIASRAHGIRALTRQAAEMTDGLIADICRCIAENRRVATTT